MDAEDEMILGYFPVIHKGYLDFIERNEEIEDIGIINPEAFPEFSHLKKDIRALDPSDMQDILWSMYECHAIRVGSIALGDSIEIEDVNQQYRRIVLPDDEVSRLLVDRHLGDVEKIEFFPTFLRWNRNNAQVNVEVHPDRTVEVSELPLNVATQMELERLKSTDIWRQVGGVLFNDPGEIIQTMHNQGLPTDYSSWIDGDIRATSRRGEGLDNYNTEHSEAGLIARAAANGQKTEGLSLLVSDFPCPQCAKCLAGAKIGKLYYFEGYAMGNGLDSLKNAGVEIIKVNGELAEVNTSQPIPYPEK